VTESTKFARNRVYIWKMMIGKKIVYLTLTAIGLVLPYYFLFRFLGENGLNIPLLVQQLFSKYI